MRSQKFLFSEDHRAK
ncbi:hypothetical protein CAEBREN_08423 [Caenorhabditis brenneri]|uniref:Uncharacterized protein n=1 Tax=Caenorhabditis brenneri TaxID=135651 RepID=G0N291_CAEBE|nr:hypothetical protein CAEBREN_08423 [Caenorhabditis brenneri]